MESAMSVIGKVCGVVDVAVWLYFAAIFVVALVVGGDNGSFIIVALALIGLVGLVAVALGITTELEDSSSNVWIL